MQVLFCVYMRFLQDLGVKGFRLVLKAACWLENQQAAVCHTPNEFWVADDIDFTSFAASR